MAPRFGLGLNIIHLHLFPFLANIRGQNMLRSRGHEYTMCAVIHNYCEFSHMPDASRLPQGRGQLVKVLAASGDVIHISDVAKALAISRTDAAKRLARWREQGWLSRVGAGAYVPASIDTLGSDRVLDDAWVLVPALFSPAYVAGRTAAEHWDLTEQIFKDIIVVTAKGLRQTHQARHGAAFPQ